jgi:type VII secretion protein EccE
VNAGSAPRGAVTPHLKSRSGRGGSFAVQRLVLLELAAALVVVGWIIGMAALVPAAVIAALLVVLAVVRRRGRSLPEWLGTLLALRARTRKAANTPLPPGTDSGLAPAVECDPNLRTYSYSRGDDRDQRRPVGMVGDGGFLTAVLQVESDAGALRADRGRRPLPVALVQDALHVDGISLESAQIVVHTQPAPALHLPQQSVVVSNYAPLQAQTGSPAVRITWIALKLDPELCPEAVAARGGGLVGAQKCLVRAAEHLSSRLTGAGFQANILTEEELTAAIATSACANPMVTAQAAQTGRDEVPQRRTEESSRNWRCDNRRHTTYWVRRWPQLGGTGTSLAQLVAQLTAVPALATTFSLTLARGDRQDVTITGHLRITRS